MFSEFRVVNADSGGRYRVTIRGSAPGDNLCTCLDFATNDLGTWKHIEFTLARLAAGRGGKAALARGYAPPYSEIVLHYGGHRSLRFRAGADCPPVLPNRAGRLFDAAAAGWVLPRPRLDELDGFITKASGTGHELRIAVCEAATGPHLLRRRHDRPIQRAAACLDALGRPDR